MKPNCAPTLARSALAEFAAAAHARGATVVLTNGAFDLLHVGHLRYLRAAAALGDVLIVAINSDASVAAAKGPSRPIIPERERAELIASIVGVDAVTLFAEPTAAAVIAAVRPHVHAKGTDYTADDVPEAAQVAALGGRVAIVGDAKDHATSTLIASLRSHAVQAS